MNRRITEGYYNYYYKLKYHLLQRIVNDLFKGMFGRFDTNYLDDFMAIAKTELLYAMIHFDSSKGSFNTFLYHRVNGTIRHYVDSSIKYFQRNDTEIHPEFVNSYYDNPVSSGLEVQELLDSLSSDEASVLRMRYLESHTLLEITKLTGFSSYKIIDLQNKAVHKLNNNFRGQIGTNL
jgi:RNA polymerase sigma factor (sigma-70 family)